MPGAGPITMHRVEEVPIERLRFGLSPRRERSDPGHVAALTEVLPEVPPVVVHTASLQVIDGVHRVLAAKSAGRRTIPAVMFDGDDVAAQIEAVRRNVTHGKPMSLPEREAAAIRVIHLVPQWSDRRIASVTGLSPRTVGRLRRRATVDVPQTRTRVGSDGRARPVDPAELRRRVAEAIRVAPHASTRAIARHTGASQATVRDVRDRLRRGLSPVLPATGKRPKRRRKRADADAQRDDEVETTQVLPPGFVDWLDQRRIDHAEWHRFVQAIPLSRIYEVADECRLLSDRWRSFATALEDRVRGRRRHCAADPDCR